PISDDDETFNLPPAGRAPGRSQAGPHPLGGSADVLVGRGVLMSQTPTQIHAELAASSRLREDLIHPDPLLDCLVEVCRLQGHAASRASISAGLPLVGGRLNLELAERAAARAGMAARLQRLPLARIDTAA